MEGKPERWWLLGVLVGVVGALAIVAGFATGGPDAVGGVVFGGVALVAAAVILSRRAYERRASRPMGKRK